MKAEPEVHRCGEFDFVTPRISDFAPLGEFGFRLRGVDPFTTFRFQKQAVDQGRVLTYITIADAMLNWRSNFIKYRVHLHPTSCVRPA